MNISTTIRFVCFSILLLATQFLAVAHNGFTDAEAEAIQAFLSENFGNTNAGMVIGLVDERGSRVLAAGKRDNGARGEVNDDTVFEIGSVTKTFTTLLLQDMVERDEVKLDDPVAKYLPESVKVPERDGKQITLLNLAIHTAGLPRDPSNLTPTRGLPENAFADYNVENWMPFCPASLWIANPDRSSNTPTSAWLCSDIFSRSRQAQITKRWWWNGFAVL